MMAEINQEKTAKQKLSHVSLDDCEMVGALGEGSFGSVVLLRNKTTGQEYALKGMSKAHLKEECQETMVQNERNIMSMLDSNFIVRMYSSYTDEKFVYLMLEPVLGGELFDVYTENDLWGKIDHAKFYAACVSLALSHMHSKRVIWRDLKLENCLINSQGFLKITDLGIAKVVVGKTYSVCGTADYFAPETLKQAGHNRAADWWACGVLLYIMIAGHSPFEAPEAPQIYKNIIKGFGKVDFPKCCPPEGEELIRALCKKKPEDRITMQKGGISNLMAMPFFDGLHWEDLLGQRLTPPFMPKPPNYEAISQRKLTRSLDFDMSKLERWGDDTPDG